MTGHCQDVGIHCPQTFQDSFSSELLAIVSVKNEWISHMAKERLKNMCNVPGSFLWDTINHCVPRGMIFDGYNPSHQNSIRVTFPQFSHINQIDLELLMEGSQFYWSPAPPCRFYA